LKREEENLSLGGAIWDKKGWCVIWLRERANYLPRQKQASNGTERVKDKDEKGSLPRFVLLYRRERANSNYLPRVGAGKGMTQRVNLPITDSSSICRAGPR